MLAFVAASFAGCAKSDTVLYVEVAAPRTILANQLYVTVSAGIDARAFYVPRDPADEPIVFPASFSVSLDRTYSAPISISIDALGVVGGTEGYVDYSGYTRQDHVEIGQQTAMVVVLTENKAPDQADAGASSATTDDAAHPSDTSIERALDAEGIESDR
ncbi:MAG TPA: hypothetical protein VHJ20_08725 [Polyangia bacterium]|nr:hypothetical protein [Polyangia bacterium]